MLKLPILLWIPGLTRMTEFSDVQRLQNKVASLESRLEQVELWRQKHAGIDAMAAGPEYPHPDMKVRSLGFGSGVGALSPLGLQFVTTSSYPSIGWVSSLRSSPDALNSPPYGIVTGNGSTTSPEVSLQAETSDGSSIVAVGTGTSSTVTAYGQRTGEEPAGMIAASGSGYAYNQLFGVVSLYATESLTIAAGVITIGKASSITVDTQSAAATDDLDTISFAAGGLNGTILIVRAADSGRTVVCKDGTGNLKLSGDCTLDNTEDTLTLIYDDAGSRWLEVCRSNNGA